MAISAKERQERMKRAQEAFNKRGYGKDYQQQTKDDREQRAGASERGFILNPDDIKGDYDTNRALLTTLGGVSRPITPKDLIVFKKNIETLQKTIKEKYKGGLTPQQIIDLSLEIDRQRANKEIHYANIYEAKLDNGLYHFITNASGKYTATRHHVHVQFSMWGGCVNSPKDALKMAQVLVKSHVKFDCDCGRHKFWYRYLATIGNYYVGRPETGYPDERNANLQGVACKHVLRTMNYLMQPSTVLILARHIQKARDDVMAKTQRQTAKEMQKELEEQQKREGGKKSQIRTSEQKARKRAVQAAKSRPSKSQKELLALIEKMAKLTNSERERLKQATNAQKISSKTLHELGITTAQEYAKELDVINKRLEAIAEIERQGQNA